MLPYNVSCWETRSDRQFLPYIFTYSSAKMTDLDDNLNAEISRLLEYPDTNISNRTSSHSSVKDNT
jgi:hypothetical protein